MFIYSQRIDFLSQTKKFRSSDGKFRFKLCYHNENQVWKCHEWQQGSNPMEMKTVTGYNEISSESQEYFGNFGGLQLAVKSPQQTKIEEVNSGAFWVGIVYKERPYRGPPNKVGVGGQGRLDWNTDPMKLSVYRVVNTGDVHSIIKVF